MSEKLAAEGQWATSLALLGYRADLTMGAIALPGPKLASDFNLVHLPVFDSGNMTVDIHAIQELRGRTNHWLPAGRLWRWLVEPVNGLLSFADNTLVWVRLADIRRWRSFWNVITFLRDATKDPDAWRSWFS